MVTHFFINDEVDKSVCGGFSKSFADQFVSCDLILQRETTLKVEEVTCKACMRTKAFKKAKEEVE